MKEWQKIIILLLGLFLTACESFTTANMIAVQKNYENEDFETAAQQLQKLSEQGNPDAQYALGYMYYYGKGVPESTIMAKYWIAQSARAGNPSAVEALNLLQRSNGPAKAPDLQDLLSSNTHPLPRAPTVQPPLLIPEPDHSYLGKQSSHPTETVVIQPKPVPVTFIPVIALPDCAPLVSDNAYRIQLMSSYSAAEVRNFTQKYGQQILLQCFRSKRPEGDWYLLTTGRYWNETDAKTALKQLPDAIKQSNSRVRLFN